MAKELVPGTSSELVVRDLNLAKRAENIRRIIAGSIVETGRELIAAQQEAGSQEVWEAWVIRDVQIGVRYAQKIMNVADMADLSGIDAVNLSNTVLLKISQPSVPTEAVTQIVERAETGERVSVKVAEEIIAQAKAEARAEQLAADREEIRPLLQHANERVANMEAVVGKATSDRRAAEKQVEELESRIATGPSQKLKEELQDAQDELYKEKKRVDGLSTDLISAKAETRRLQLAMRTSDDNVAARQALMSAVRRAITALQDITYQDASNVHLQRGDRGVLDSLGVEIEKAGQFLEQFSQVVEAD